MVLISTHKGRIEERRTCLASRKGLKSRILPGDLAVKGRKGYRFILLLCWVKRPGEVKKNFRPLTKQSKFPRLKKETDGFGDRKDYLRKGCNLAGGGGGG